MDGTPTNLTVAAASGTGTTTYQWYSNTTNSVSGGTAISGATSATYTPPSATSGTTYYYCVVTGTCGTVTSSVSGAQVVNSTITPYDDMQSLISL